MRVFVALVLMAGLLVRAGTAAIVGDWMLVVLLGLSTALLGTIAYERWAEPRWDP